MRGFQMHAVLLLALLAPSASASPERAEIRVPAGAPPAKGWPVLLVFGGFEEAGRVLDLVKTRVPVVLASFDYPVEKDRKFRFPETLFRLPGYRRAVRETVQGIPELVRKARAVPGVDPARVAILGSSFGVPFAVAGAVRTDPPPSHLLLIHGFADVEGVLRHRLGQVFRRKFGEDSRLARPLAGGAAWLLPRFLGAPEPAREARKLAASTRVLLLEAGDDSFIPEESRDALWEAVRGAHDQARIVIPGDHLQPGADEQVRDLTERAEAWLGFTGFF